MASEQDILLAARLHRDELLAEVETRRLLRKVRPGRDGSAPTRRRLQTLLRRLAGAPTFA